MRPVRLGEIEPLIRRLRGPDLVPFKPKHPRKRVGHAHVVIDDEDACDAGFRLFGGHRPIVGFTGQGVKGARRSMALIDRGFGGLVLYSARFRPETTGQASVVRLRRRWY